MKPSEKDYLHDFIGSPYNPPSVRVGDWLTDEIHGLVQVGGWTDAQVSWPYRKKTGRHSLILCGDLVEAVKTESVAAIKYHFGVGVVTIWAWRQALGVPRTNDGTLRLYRLQKPEKLPDDVAARGREMAATPEARQKMADTKRGKPAHPNTAQALREAVSKPKPPGWGKRANEWMSRKNGVNEQKT